MRQCLGKIHAVIDLNGPRVCVYPEYPSGCLRFNVAINGNEFKGVDSMLLRDDYKVTASVAPVDKFGHPASVDGAVVWASSDESIVTVTPSDDTLSCVIVPTGALGAVQVAARADADLGDGVKEITGLLDIEVVAGEAVALAVTAGTPEPNV